MHKRKYRNSRGSLQIDQWAESWQHADLLLPWGVLPLPCSDENLLPQWCLETSPQDISPSEMQTWVMEMICPGKKKIPLTSYFLALQWLSALTPTFWSTGTSCLLRKSTLWTMRPPTSVTLDTHCEALPDASAYQMGSGAAPLPSAAVTVSPDSFLIAYLCHLNAHVVCRFFRRSGGSLSWSRYPGWCYKNRQHFWNWWQSEIHLQQQPVPDGIQWKDVSGEQPVDWQWTSMLL